MADRDSRRHHAGAVAAWGILELVLLASLFTLIEVGGLVAIIAAAVHMDLPIASALVQPPPLDPRHPLGYRLRQPAGLLRLHRI